MNFSRTIDGGGGGGGSGTKAIPHSQLMHQLQRANHFQKKRAIVRCRHTHVPDDSVQFETTSTDLSVKEAIANLNHLKTGLLKTGTPLALLGNLPSGPETLTDTLGSVVNTSPLPSPVAQKVLSAGPIIPSRMRPHSSNATRSMPQSRPSSPASSMRGWALTLHPAADAALTVVDADASERQRVTEAGKINEYRPSSAPPGGSSRNWLPDGHDSVQLVPTADVDALRHITGWSLYWGNVSHLHALHNALVDRVADAERRAHLASADKAFVDDILRNISESTEALRMAMEEGQRLAETAIAQEKGRLDAFEKHNELLSAKIVEMRRQVALAERSMNAMQLELETAQAEVARRRTELETIHNKHAIEMLQLKQELTSNDATAAQRLLRVEILEGEVARRDETIHTLQKMIDVVNEEKQRLHEKIDGLNRVQELAAKPAAASSVTVDVASIQNMTARQYQRREAELLETARTLRRENGQLAFGVDCLKDRIRRMSAVVEQELMVLDDHDACRPVTIPTAPQSPTSSPTRAARRASAKQLPLAPPYACGPLVVPRPPEDCPEPSAPILTKLHAFVDGLVTRFWMTADRFIPEHPQRQPSGERESLHADLVTSVDSFGAIMADIANGWKLSMNQSKRDGNEKLAELLLRITAAEVARDDVEKESALLRLGAEESSGLIGNVLTQLCGALPASFQTQLNSSLAAQTAPQDTTAWFSRYAELRSHAAGALLCDMVHRTQVLGNTLRQWWQSTEAQHKVAMADAERLSAQLSSAQQSSEAVKRVDDLVMELEGLKKSIGELQRLRDDGVIALASANERVHALESELTNLQHVHAALQQQKGDAKVAEDHVQRITQLQRQLDSVGNESGALSRKLQAAELALAAAQTETARVARQSEQQLEVVVSRCGEYEEKLKQQARLLQQLRLQLAQANRQETEGGNGADSLPIFQRPSSAASCPAQADRGLALSVDSRIRPSSASSKSAITNALPSSLKGRRSPSPLPAEEPESGVGCHSSVAVLRQKIHHARSPLLSQQLQHAVDASLHPSLSQLVVSSRSLLGPPHPTHVHDGSSVGHPLYYAGSSADHPISYRQHLVSLDAVGKPFFEIQPLSLESHSDRKSPVFSV